MVGHFSFTSFIYIPDSLMNPWVQMAFATPVQFFIGKQFYVGAYKSLKNKSVEYGCFSCAWNIRCLFLQCYLSIQSIGSSIIRSDYILKQVPS